jgi:hypothetical protein
MALLFLIGIAVALLIMRDVMRKAARRRALVSRFGEDIANRITQHQIWQGQTAEMLLESRGKPEDADERVFKRTTRHVFKYNRTGKKTFALRVTFEDGIVVGWDDKR